MTKIPCYKAVIDLNENETGVFRVSLVEYPAVEVNWQLFSKEPEPLKFSVQDDERHLVTGVLMKADTPIYRKTPDGYGFNIVFDRDTVRTMAEKMLTYGYQNRLNTDHNPETFVPGMNIQEMYFKDSAKGISPAGFDDVPDGSLFATYKVHNVEIWDEIKKGTWKGFSVEALTRMELIEPEVDAEEQEVLSLIDKLNKKLKNR